MDLLLLLCVPPARLAEETPILAGHQPRLSQPCLGIVCAKPLHYLCWHVWEEHRRSRHAEVLAATLLRLHLQQLFGVEPPSANWGRATKSVTIDPIQLRMHHVCCTQCTLARIQNAKARHVTTDWHNNYPKAKKSCQLCCWHACVSLTLSTQTERERETERESPC